MGFISVSSALLASYLGRRYYDLDATIHVMKGLAKEGAIDGFEFQLLGEWNGSFPPLCVDARYDRKLEWELSTKHDFESIAEKLNRSKLKILSVHANRDVGMCLSSDSDEMLERGKTLIERALCFSEMIDAGTCVFHLWDAWSEDIDYERTERIFAESVRSHPGIIASVENIPTYKKDVSPLVLVREYDWITLDVRWAMKYEELADFNEVLDRVVNIHLRGEYRRGKWLFDGSPGVFLDILNRIKNEWGYDRLITVEPEAELVDISWRDMVHAFSLLK
jgi:hypothetical protein